jgi:hypothetical protein
MDTYDIICDGAILIGLMLFLFPLMFSLVPTDAFYYKNVSVPCYDHAWNVIKDQTCIDKQYIEPDANPLTVVICIFGFTLFITGLLFNGIKKEFRPKPKGLNTPHS